MKELSEMLGVVVVLLITMFVGAAIIGSTPSAKKERADMAKKYKEEHPMKLNVDHDTYHYGDKDVYEYYRHEGSKTQRTGLIFVSEKRVCYIYAKDDKGKIHTFNYNDCVSIEVDKDATQSRCINLSRDYRDLDCKFFALVLTEAEAKSLSKTLEKLDIYSSILTD